MSIETETKDETEQQEQEKSLDELLGEAYDASQEEDETEQQEAAEEAPAEEEEETEESEDAPAEASEEESEEEAEDEETADTEEPTSEVPDAWSAEQKERFENLDPDAKAFALELAKPQEELPADAKPVFDAIERSKSYLDQLGVSPDEAFSNLIETDRQLRTAAPDVKKALAKQLLADYGIELDQPQPQAQPQGQEQQDEALFVDPKVQQLETQVSSLQQTFEQQKIAEAQAQINAFDNAKDDNGNLLHPHAKTAWPQMEIIIQSERAQGRQVDLHAAYEQAIWANPQLRAEMLKQQEEAKQAVQKKQEAEHRQKAKKAAKTKVKTRTQPARKSEPKGMTETLEETWDRLHQAQG